MIITFSLPLKVGKIYNQDDNIGFIVIDERHDKFTFLVLREVNLKEFEDYINSEFPDHAASIRRDGYYYEISMD